MVALGLSWVGWAANVCVLGRNGWRPDAKQWTHAECWSCMLVCCGTHDGLLISFWCKSSCCYFAMCVLVWGKHASLPLCNGSLAACISCCSSHHTHIYTHGMPLITHPYIFLAHSCHAFAFVCASHGRPSSATPPSPLSAAAAHQ